MHILDCSRERQIGINCQKNIEKKRKSEKILLTKRREHFIIYMYIF